ncbi:MAG: adenylate cyclase [Flavobacteriales bacterium]|jgi:adenylate cyclase
MAVEIERKFLVKNEEWRNQVDESFEISQGYLNSSIDRNVRVRIKGEQAFLTIKTKTKSITRTEFEYEIPLEDGLQLIDICEKPIIKKRRHLIIQNQHTWELDVFKLENQGLLIAEIELSSEEEQFKTPSWLGKEVSDDTRYFNSALIKHPFSKW